jgi:hypothetical protein
MIKNILVIFFLVNAIFWGLASHSSHCHLAANIGISNCPPHWIHVYVMGIGFFLVSIFLKQGFVGFNK